MANMAEHPSMQQFIASRTPDELESLIQIIRTQVSAKTSSTKPAKGTVSGKFKASSSAAVTKPKSAVPGNQRKRREPNNKSKRPLNSFVAFRSYYRPAFGSMQQKNVSPLMRSLWAAEPFHATWAIIAKGFTVFRDQGAAPVGSLGRYLDIACPYVGMIKAEDYFTKLGWKVEANDNGLTLNRVFVPDPQSLTGKSSITVADIMKHCQDAGFTNNFSHGGITDPSMGSSSASLTMSVQPPTGISAQKFHFGSSGVFGNVGPTLPPGKTNMDMISAPMSVSQKSTTRQTDLIVRHFTNHSSELSANQQLGNRHLSSLGYQFGLGPMSYHQLPNAAPPSLTPFNYTVQQGMIVPAGGFVGNHSSAIPQNFEMHGGYVNPMNEPTPGTDSSPADSVEAEDGEVEASTSSSAGENTIYMANGVTEANLQDDEDLFINYRPATLVPTGSDYNVGNVEMHEFIKLFEDSGTEYPYNDQFRPGVEPDLVWYNSGTDFNPSGCEIDMNAGLDPEFFNFD